jgi:hypothetical protein
MSKLTRIFSDNEKKSVETDSSEKVNRPPSRSRARRAIGGKKSGSNTVSSGTAGDESSGEHEAVAKARKALKPLIEQTTKGKEPISIGLVLAILNQETGNNAAANVLIEEYKLDKIFGLKKF